MSPAEPAHSPRRTRLSTPARLTVCLHLDQSCDLDQSPSSAPPASSSPSTGDTWSVSWPWKRRTLPSLDASVRCATTGARPAAARGANSRSDKSRALEKQEDRGLFPPTSDDRSIRFERDVTSRPCPALATFMMSCRCTCLPLVET
ncbi:MAG: hypothetical protein QOJ42_5109 [Acidobacteriaceae bacterium]|nr:hypothetical protein [Acidobacteriaceae bacterium]